MAFDDELRRTIETLTDRVRQEVGRQLAAVTDELAAAAAAERRAAAFDAAASARAAVEEDAEARVADALAAAATAEQVAESRGRESGVEAGRLEGIEIGRREGLEIGRREGRDEGRDAGYQVGREAGLAEGRAEGEQSARAEFQAAAAAAAERLVDAFRAIDRAGSLTEILDTLASCAMREAARVAVLVLEGEMLRGWRVMGFSSSAPEPAIEVSAVDGSVLAEAVATGGPVSHTNSSAPPPAFAQLTHGRPFLALAIRVGGDVVAVIYADQGADAAGASAAHPGTGVVQWMAAVEVLVRHAARCLEAVTAVRAAQVFRTASPPALPGRDEDAARRYARLLVSEIKLYHEAEVMAGRRERDLATRLGGEIARARVLYEQRLPPEARRGADHFHAELVRMLADGDATLLEVRQ